ncbi:Cep3p KNAG_0I00780 [Huiozyma naganishii CBS 8797]|uniref:Zn(2)-C6 fungal-type domain-containing protein n=1 Tax=Huiozyma naganishii (strain ATCC MYA-139 / BCRC 22969 / CBS 8797 / KCTC 17520 / NBRC 10181 / NCYC 3082 / Yp74L-3) TaxID=1071383 RepID=J7S921_HUIN7|nr:hypothetical protein KNAG_0I00780 [Kazachstania naganishii CBS 8797]CCK71869.1 hypothetical protein KNAG_0I00780 [Kazachstania naganishii CBS 8797]
MSRRPMGNKSEQSCAACFRKKVKCDRLVPCGNCVKKGRQAECLRSFTNKHTSNAFAPDNDDHAGILQLWQSYEYWISNVGLLKTKEADTKKAKVDLDDQLRISKFCLEYLQEGPSFNILNFSLENLGALYFGCIGDINELFLQLEMYWRRRKHGPYASTSEDYYWDALLWAVFSMSIYYIPLSELSELLPSEPLCNWLQIDVNQGWTESLQLTAYQCFTKCTMVLLKQAEPMSYPDIKLVQIYLILTMTTFTYEEPILSNSLILQSTHVAKMFHINFFRQYSEDDLAVGLTKQTFSKLWFKLSAADYLQSGPGKPLEFHTDIPSLLQHAAYYQDMPHFNVYENEDDFEVFCWKMFSLDREIDRFLDRDIKPQSKTLDAVKRELGIFHTKLNTPSDEKKNTISSQFERFVSTFLLNSMQWKLQKVYLVYFNTANALELTIHYSQVLIRLLVHNITNGNEMFNKFPYVLNALGRIVPFYSYHSIFFARTARLDQLIEDLKELLNVLPIMLGDKVNKLTFVSARLDALAILWGKVKIVDSGSGVIHPVFKILQNDILFVSKVNSTIPLLVKGVRNIGDNQNIDDQVLASEGDDRDLFESDEFKAIVSTFQSDHNIEELIF